MDNLLRGTVMKKKRRTEIRLGSVKLKAVIDYYIGDIQRRNCAIDPSTQTDLPLCFDI